MKKILRFILPILIVFIFFDILFYYYKTNFVKINDNDFLFTFTGVLLGFSITLFPFIVNLVDKIKLKADEKYKDNIKGVMDVEKRISKLLKEVKDDILFIFISLVIITSMYIFQYIDTPIASNSFENFITKEIVFKAIKFTIFTLNIYAIYDLISVSFILSDSTAILNINNGKKL